MTETTETKKEATPETVAAATEAPAKGKRKKSKINVSTGTFHVLASFNNTILTVTDVNGNALAWSSSASKGFRGSKKGTPFAAQVAAEDLVRKAKDCGIRNANIIVKGPGAGRESALRSIVSSGIRISNIRDLTPIPHNGCRPPKKRRV